MSLTDTHFTYFSGNDSSSLPRTRSNVGCVGQLPTRRSSSVKSPRQRDVVGSRDVDAALRWSRRSLSIQKLAQEFDRQFPVLARVMQDYRCSNVNGLKLNVGQVSYYYIITILLLSITFRALSPTRRCARAVLASIWLSVCLSVCLSHAGNVSNRLSGSTCLAQGLPSIYPTLC